MPSQSVLSEDGSTVKVRGVPFYAFSTFGFLAAIFLAASISIELYVAVKLGAVGAIFYQLIVDCFSFLSLFYHYSIGITAIALSKGFLIWQVYFTEQTLLKDTLLSFTTYSLYVYAAFAILAGAALILMLVKKSDIFPFLPNQKTTWEQGATGQQDIRYFSISTFSTDSDGSEYERLKTCA